MKNLPIGIQDFEKIIKNNNIYVDKTEIIHKLITFGDYYFLSRPRRFGKSLLISTLENIFKGNKKLFKGLYIYDKIDWKEYPIIRLDFSMINNSVKQERFIKNICVKLDIIADEYNVQLIQDDLTNRIEELIMKLSKIGQVVILIDEYDKPLIDHLTNIDKARENREILRQLYSPLKGMDKYIKFVFLTGVSRFSKVSIFPGLNNLKDITLSDKYSNICGITQSELEKYFDEHIREAVDKMGQKKEELLIKIKNFYNGYSWDGKVTVYNPFSLLNFFDDKKFINYWFNTATPTFLINMFKEKHVEISELEKTMLDGMAIESYDIDNIKVLPLLLQTGYLTIKEIKTNALGQPVYVLGYPNQEVKQSMLVNLIESYTVTANEQTMERTRDLLDKLTKDDIDGFTKILQSIFAGIPKRLQRNQKESYFQSMFYLVLELLGGGVDMEVITDKGRADAVLKLSDKIYVIEFKLGSPKEAIKQIKKMKYYEKYMNEGKDIYLLGVGGFEKKDIKCLCEKIATTNHIL